MGGGGFFCGMGFSGFCGRSFLHPTPSIVTAREDECHDTLAGMRRCQRPCEIVLTEGGVSGGNHERQGSPWPWDMPLRFSQLKTSPPKLPLALPKIPAMLTLSPLPGDRHPEQVRDPKIRVPANPRWPSQPGPHKVSGDRPFCRGRARRGIIIVFGEKEEPGVSWPLCSLRPGANPHANANCFGSEPSLSPPAPHSLWRGDTREPTAIFSAPASVVRAVKHTLAHTCLLIKPIVIVGSPHWSNPWGSLGNELQKCTQCDQVSSSFGF